jgi:peroxiredoxin
MPELASLTNTHKDKLVVLGLSIMDKDAKLQSFLQKHPLPYTIINSGTAASAVPLEYGVATPDGSYSAPVSVLIRPGGEIVYVQEGSSDKQTLLLDQINLFLNPKS